MPTIMLDHTLLLLRHAGVQGAERFLIWAGTLGADEAFVSTVVIPRVDAGSMHGEVPVDVAARVFQALDTRDLIPLAQVHSHPGGARMSPTDRERPLVAIKGFWSIIIPDFAFVSPTDVRRWGIYEYRAKRQWHTLSVNEKRDRLIADDSFIQVD